MPKKIPMRKCIGCGEMKPKGELIRVLHMADDSFTLDATGRKNGRGAYICKSGACLEQAIKTKGLDRSFKMKIPALVYEQLSEELERIEQ